jgi:hypothetical protein
VQVDSKLESPDHAHFEELLQILGWFGEWESDLKDWVHPMNGKPFTLNPK